jgi:hypothetical protein
MPITASEVQPVSPRRIRLLVLPREHGAWGILLVPLVTGAAAGFREGRGVLALALFAVTALALFCLRTPVETLMEATPWRASSPREKGVVYIALGVYASIAALALGVLLVGLGNYLLLVLGAAVLVIFLAQAAIKKLNRENRMLAQLIGALGLTSTAAGSYYVFTGRFDSRALMVWSLNWFFAANQIQFVQLRIRSARAERPGEKFQLGWAYLVGELITTLALLGGWLSGSLPVAAALAFLPVFYRGTAWFFKRPAPLRIHRLGISELIHAIAFGALLILAFSLPPA